MRVEPVARGAAPSYHRAVLTARRSPLAFVSTYGAAHLDATLPFGGPYFVLAAVLIEANKADPLRRALEPHLAALPAAIESDELSRAIHLVSKLPFNLYAIVVDKREIRPGASITYDGAATKLLSGLLYRKLFDALPDLHVTARSEGTASFMEDFSRFLAENHRATLFDRPRVDFGAPASEPLLLLADTIARVLSRLYADGKTRGRAADLFSVLRDRAVLVDEWPVRHRLATGTGAVVAGDPADDDLARYGLERAEEFLAANETRIDEEARAQVVILKKLLYEARFGDPHAYMSSQALRETLDAVGFPSGEQWLRSNVIARLRDAGVLVASSPQGYKIPVAIADIAAFVAVTDTVVHPMLNRVARAREAVLRVTKGRVDVLAGDDLDLLRHAVDAIGNDARPREEKT